MSLATEKGKEFALAQLEARRELAKGEKRINNEDLPAGAPMYYYCRLCGLIADILGELHLNPPRRFCEECQALKDVGWVE